ncbi:mitochondrial fission ELM1 family protein [Rhodovibrio salinarum]|nr:mitochondrial fission ELM1 family protein [Rhodovibrio salinarum]
MAGTENQCLGLAEALGLRPTVKRIQLRAPWRWLPPKLWLRPLAALSRSGDTLAPPWPDVLIASGRKAAAPALAVRQASSGTTFTVFVQAPPLDPAGFDAVVAPRHDDVAGPTVIPVVGALTRVTRKRLDEAYRQFHPLVRDLPRPRIAVLIGGNSKAHRLTPETARQLAQDLTAMQERTGCSFMVTTSRRTGEENAGYLRAALAEMPHVFYQAGVSEGENPYFGFLAHAEEIIVSEDSVTMACEAASTGRPVQVVALTGGKPKFDRFHAQLRDLGIARPFDGQLAGRAVQPLDETRRAAGKVKAWLDKHRARLKTE